MSKPGALDRRITPARRDLAAAFLEGHVAAARYVAGARRVVGAEIADLRRGPRFDAPLETQAIHGEPVTLYDEEEGWAWVQLETDGYVGYLPAQALAEDASPPTHVVAVNRTFVYAAADMKQVVIMALPLGARVSIVETQGSFVRIARGGFVFAPHLASIDAVERDFVAVAERLMHTPYLWGGKSSQGVDCSGLVQLALSRAGRSVRRDTDLQRDTIGEAVSFDKSLAGLRRGDLVFWPGHVGIMTDATMLIHANAHHMSVASEPLLQARERIAATSQADIFAIKRVDPDN